MDSDRAITASILGVACVLALAGCGGGGSSGSPMAQPTTAMTDTALASNGVIAAAHTDSNLLNAWGLAAAPGGPFWIADNNSNKSTLYDGNGTPQSLVVSIPAGANGPANPTGQGFNGTTDFVITTSKGSAPAQFIFSGEGGTITGWASGMTATVAYDDAAGGAVY